MNFDSRLRDGLRQAVDGHDLREDAALHEVKATQPTESADFAVGSLEDLVSQRSQHARTQRIVGAVAACALVAGAVALPVALRNRTRGPAPSTAGQSVTTGYRTTVTVRVGLAQSQSSTPTTQPLGIRLGNPVRLALASATRNTALRETHLGSNDPGIGFQATTDASGDVLTLTVIAPTRGEATTLARNWAHTFVDIRRTDASRQILDDQRNVALRVTELRAELQRVDTQLVKLAPTTYKDLLRFDGGFNNFGGRSAPPQVPERGSPHLLNLAFERIQILASLTQSSRRAAELRFASLSSISEVLAQLVSQTPAVRIRPPHRDSNTPTTVMAIGLLLTGLVLATSAFRLSRGRSRGLSPSH
jgi:hypothetical protein